MAYEVASGSGSALRTVMAAGSGMPQRRMPSGLLDGDITLTFYCTWVDLDRTGSTVIL